MALLDKKGPPSRGGPRPGLGCDSGVLTCSSDESSSDYNATSVEASARNSITGRLSDVHGKYSVDPDRIVGAGSRATVVRECVDRETGRRCAVKTIRKTSSAIERANLRREVKLLLEVRHDRVVRLVDFHEDAENLHIVIDLYSGGDLLERINEAKRSSPSGRLDEPEAARVLRQILSGLLYLHGMDVVHRDLKPENVVFETKEEDSPVRIVDLGAARTHRRDEPPMTTLVGTPRFLAPEVLRQKYDKRCDLWSAGAIAFLMLSGRLPFDGKSNQEVLDAVRRGKYTFRTEHWDGVSEEAKDFVRRLLQTNPKKRMTIAGALAHPWMTMHCKTSEGGDPAAETSRADDGTKKTRRRNWLPRGGLTRKVGLSAFR